MNIAKKSYYLLFIIILSISIRVCLFYTYWGTTQHGSAGKYGSAAVGLFYDEGLTINKSEQKKINDIGNNYYGNYLSFHDSKCRKPFTQFLPGPSILLYSLWKVLPVYNFSPYIWLQIILESVLISFFYFALSKIDITVALTTAILMSINPVTIKNTLTMGYDFWPYFCVLVNFIGIVLAIKSKKAGFILLFIGILTGLIIWFRSITSILPFYITIFLLLYLRLIEKKRYMKIGTNIALYLVSVIIAMTSLSIYRYELTGSYRPTRSTFWHSFWAGVGQFSNPYGLPSNDIAVWKFGQKLNSELADYRLSEMYDSPSSLYEQTLKKEAYRFIKRHPFLFIRNILYRTVIMISPVMYRNSNFIPEGLSSYFFYLGFGLLFIWVVGMCELFKRSSLVFWLSATIYVYFFSTMGSFYIVGRTIIPFLFINIFVYLFGIKFSIRLAKRLMGKQLDQLLGYQK